MPLPGENRGEFRCRNLVRFEMVPVRIAVEVPEGSGAETVSDVMYSHTCRFALRGGAECNRQSVTKQTRSICCA